MEEGVAQAPMGQHTEAPRLEKREAPQSRHTAEEVAAGVVE